MSSAQDKRGDRLRKTLTALGAAATLALAACSQAPSAGAENWAMRDDQASNDPPGAALPLSLGGQIQVGGDDALSTAVHCAAALGLTAQRLSSVTDNPLSAEIVLMGRAEEFFIARAGEAALQINTDASSVPDSVARARQSKASEVTEQAQLAIACLRRFGDSVTDQTAPIS